MVSAINITMILVCLLSLIEPVRQFLLREDGVIPVSLRIYSIDVQRHYITERNDWDCSSDHCIWK